MEFRRLERPTKPRRGTSPRPHGEALRPDAGKQPYLAPIVTIFGAGIAGLSAAHELIERGFYVQVVESKMSPDEEYAAEVGGLACNQFGRVRESPEILHASGPDAAPDPDFLSRLERVRRLRSSEMQRVQPRFETPWRIRFRRAEPGQPPEMPEPLSGFDPTLTDEWGVENGTKLRTLWSKIKLAHQAYGGTIDAGAAGEDSPRPGDSLPAEWRARETLRVELRGHSNGDRSEVENRHLSGHWAHEVKEQLRAFNDQERVFAQFDLHFTLVAVGSAEPLGDQREKVWRERTNRVEFRIVEQLIPGEHGYRFFPAFYRHLFDLMRRTPILGKDGHPTGETAYDRLVPTRDLGIAVGDNAPLKSIETRRVRSLKELWMLSDLFLRRLGVTHRDIIRFQTRLLKFLSSSPARRAREYEQMSWWTFLGGDDERGYSDRMRKYLMETSQALVAMNAEETDARSQGNIVAQLQLHYLEDQYDYTLNGPTSDVWLRPWKRYLKSQGVRFFVGELVALNWKDTQSSEPELVPVTGHRSGWLSPAVRKQAPEPAGEGKPTGGDALVARRLGRRIVIDVLGDDPGDYSIVVSERLYCVSAAGDSAEEIAGKLALELDEDDRLWATRTGRRIVVRPSAQQRLELGHGPWWFDRSLDPAVTREIELSAEAMKAPPEHGSALRSKLEGHIQAFESFRRIAEATGGGTGRRGSGPPAPDLGDQEWIAAGLQRARDPEFDRTLSDYEQRSQRELVPRLDFDENSRILVISPPEWVRTAVLAQTDPESEELGDGVQVLWPYASRLRTAGGTAPARPPAQAAAADSEPKPAFTSAWMERAIWIQVRNVHGNLKVIDQPMAEDPDDDYWSHSELPPAFRPDFYVLALPLTEASRLLWRAEAERPGRLHGSLAEMLDFDRWSGRRTATGAPIPVIRDADGRPPHEHPLRDFAGVQYYFQNQVRIGAGHIYYPRAEWGLSSISQLAYWRERLSPAGPFIGQLSVDIGNFYKRAPARLGNRVRRSAWNSTPEEIASEVWFQVRQGLDRERATLLVAPSYYHLDQGLSFDYPLGRVLRDTVTIEVKAPPGPATFTIWAHGQRFCVHAQVDPQTIAQTLKTAITAAFPEAVAADVEPGGQKPLARLVLRSTIPEGAALLYVTDGKPGRYEVSFEIENRVHAYSYIQETRPSRKAVRNGLFAALVRDQSLPVVAELSRGFGIRLLPKGGGELPRVLVRNDHQQLRVIHGARLEVRLDQCHGCLAFGGEPIATIGENLTPFLINVPGQWQHRPGLLKDVDLTFDQSILRPRDDERIRYRISNKRWVAAGTHMATTTQLTTMESASESARHAVNAILRCLSFRAGNEYNAQGQVFADLAEIWDPEKNELDDLEPLRRLDRQLVEEGLPHVMDILKITEAVDAMPMHGKPSHDPMANVLHLAQHLVEGFDRDWGFAKQTLNDLMGQAVERTHDALDPTGLLRELRNGPAQVGERLREFLQGLLTRAGSTPGSGTSGPDE